MEYNSIYLSRKELKRFLQIANGSTEASNTPDEDALFRKKLVKEQIIAKICSYTGASSVDLRAVVLSDFGKEYYALHMNHRKKVRQETFKYLISTLIGILAALPGILGAITAIQG